MVSSDTREELLEYGMSLEVLPKLLGNLGEKKSSWCKLPAGVLIHSRAEQCLVVPPIPGKVVFPQARPTP